MPRRAAPEGIPVRYVEGTVHGFFELRTATGTLLANGDLLLSPIEAYANLNSQAESRLGGNVVVTRIEATK